jgi:hypothetical protein
MNRIQEIEERFFYKYRNSTEKGGFVDSVDGGLDPELIWQFYRTEIQSLLGGLLVEIEGMKKKLDSNTNFAVEVNPFLNGYNEALILIQQKIKEIKQNV